MSTIKANRYENTASADGGINIDSSGRVLLGTTTEGEATADNLTIEDSGHCGITLRSGTSSVGTVFFSDGTSGTDEYRGYVQYDHSGNFLKWATDATERMRISNTGKTTITGATNGELSIKAGSASGNDIIAFVNSGGTTRGNITYDTDNNFLLFNVNQSERARITNAGIVCINRTSVVHGGQLSLDYTNGTTAGLAIKDTQTSGTGAVLQVVNGSGTIVGSITQNQSTTSFNTSSDYRLKENVVDVTDGITRVKQLQPKRFNFIADDSRTVDGFLAHEAQTVVPEAVTGTHNAVEVWKEGEELPDGVSVGDNKLDEDGNTIPEYQGIDQSKLVPLLTAALQEAISKIETLEAKVAALEAA